MLKNTKLLLLTLLFFTSISFAQIKIIEFPVPNYGETDSLFFDITSTRNIIPLSKNWHLYLPENPENKIDVTIPSIFINENSVVYQREFNFSPEQILNYKFEFVSFGINYMCEIFINNVSLYKHAGGTYPFTVEIPKDILNYDVPNVLQIKVYHKLDAKNTIPVKPRFLFPDSKGGILRDLYIKLIPLKRLENINYTFTSSKRNKKTKAKLNIKFDIVDESPTGEEGQINYKCYLQFYDPAKETILYSKDFNIKFKNSRKVKKSVNISLSNPEFWDLTARKNYFLRLVLSDGENILDEYKQNIPLRKISLTRNGIKLNGKKITIKGVTYITSSDVFYTDDLYDVFKRDIKIIKDAGFNAVRFAKDIPHPYLLKLCEDYGLFAFVELPINSIPEKFLNTEEFLIRSENYINQLTNYYKHFPMLAGIGLGGSFLPDNQINMEFVKKLAGIVKQNSGLLTYASFVGIQKDSIDNLDLYGIELYAKTLPSGFQPDNKINYFISEATYPTYNGETNGYLNIFSFEGQAKYFNDIITQTRKLGLKGYFLNSMFDFKGDFIPMFSGYDENKIYKIGLLGIDRKSDRASFNIIKARVKNGKRINIPLGDKSDDSPLFFIIASLVLSFLLGLLINSNKKFREDAIRALLRPYNFYADIRDQRILSGFNTNFLMILLAGSHALLLTNLLYFLKNNILIEKMLIALGSPGYISVVSSLAWNPVDAFVAFFLLSIIGFWVLAIVTKIASFFIKNRVIFSSIYYVVIWAFLPLTILLPLELVLYRILMADLINWYLYFFIILFGFWLVQRLLKGIYVIFDVRPSPVYFYGFLLAVLILGTVILYFQLSEYTLFYFINAIKQYQFL